MVNIDLNLNVNLVQKGKLIGVFSSLDVQSYGRPSGLLQTNNRILMESCQMVIKTAIKQDEIADYLAPYLYCQGVFNFCGRIYYSHLLLFRLRRPRIMALSIPCIDPIFSAP